MARTSRPGPYLQPQPGSRPRPLRRGPWDNLFRTYIHLILALQLGDDSVVLIPSVDYDEDPTPDDPEAEMPTPDHSDMYRVWKTTVLYEQIDEPHPRIVRFRCRDPFTAPPILERPSGSTLIDFLAKHKATMYSEGRILPRYLPLMYQWALHLASALSFVHSHDIIYGDLSAETCWLSSSLSLSLVGFLDASYVAPSRIRYLGDPATDQPFHPCNLPRFQTIPSTMRTDLFLWGCLVHRLMTGSWPGRGRPHRDVEQMLWNIDGRPWNRNILVRL